MIGLKTLFGLSIIQFRVTSQSFSVVESGNHLFCSVEDHCRSFHNLLHSFRSEMEFSSLVFLTFL